MAEKTASMTSDEDSRPTSAAERKLGMRLVAWTRFIVIIPVLGLFIGSISMVVLATGEAVSSVGAIIAKQSSLKEATVAFIELADVYLLAIVLYIMALGLFELFIDNRLPLPAWLKIRHLEDLKEKLVSVVIVVLGVLFLGKVTEGSATYLELLYLGGGIALVSAALTYFVGRVLVKGHHDPQ